MEINIFRFARDPNKSKTASVVVIDWSEPLFLSFSSFVNLSSWPDTQSVKVWWRGLCGIVVARIFEQGQLRLGIVDGRYQLLHVRRVSQGHAHRHALDDFHNVGHE